MADTHFYKNTTHTTSTAIFLLSDHIFIYAADYSGGSYWAIQVAWHFTLCQLVNDIVCIASVIDPFTKIRNGMIDHEELLLQGVVYLSKRISCITFFSFNATFLKLLFYPDRPVSAIRIYAIKMTLSVLHMSYAFWCFYLRCSRF